MKKLVGLLAVGCMALVGFVGSPATAGAVPAATSTPDAGTVQPASIAWGPCASARLQSVGAQCGFVSVPLDYSRRRGTKIRLAVSRVRHTTPDSQYQGVMLVNPGGPGGSGLGLSILGEFVPNHAGDAYDWIGFDPRGVGSSEPSLSCNPNYFHGNRPPYVPSTLAIRNRWLNRSSAYADACAADNLALLKHVKTIDSARDMDRIRAALGAPRINYYGFSYGTYLGQVYASLFPNRVRRMVLDSNVDPRGVWYEANLQQDIAFERNIKIWFAWLAKYDSVYHLGKTRSAVSKTFFTQEALLRNNPAGGIVGSAEWDDAFLYAGYYQVTWTDLANAFSAWVNQHDPAPLIAAYQDADGPGDDNGYAMYLATECSEGKWPRRYSTYARDNWRVYRIAPFFTWGNAWFNAPCLFWPVKAGKPVKIKGDHVRALLIDETLDAATPYEGSLKVRKLFPKSSLIALPGGTSHANSLNGNACLDDQIAAYLADGTLPARVSGNRADATCAPLPVPVPEPATAPAAKVKGAVAARAARPLVRR